MILEIEESAEKIASYPVDESQKISNAGDAIAYEYDGKQYEIITWNERAEEHQTGEKTITEITKEKE